MEEARLGNGRLHRCVLCSSVDYMGVGRCLVRVFPNPLDAVPKASKEIS